MGNAFFTMDPAQYGPARLKRKRAEFELTTEAKEEMDPEAQDEQRMEEEEQSDDEKAETTKICRTEGCGPHPLSDFYRDRNKLEARCKRCCAVISAVQRTKRPTFFSMMAMDCKYNAKRRSGPASTCSITKDDLNSMWDLQTGFCALTGVPMRHAPNSDFKASPERIDNAIGYVQGNVVLIISELNTPSQWTPAKLDVWLANQTPTPDQHTTQDAHVHALANPPPPPHRQNHSSIWRGLVGGVPSIRCNGCDRTMTTVEFGVHKARCVRCLRDHHKRYCLTLRGAMVKLLGSARAHTKQRREGKGGEPCTITAEHLEAMFVAQRGRCHWTNIPMVLGASHDISWRCSLERLNVARGYIPGNVVLACFEANPMDQTNRGKGSSGEEGSAGWTRNKINHVLQHLQQKRANEATA